MGLDAMERVLRKAKYEGMGAFGQNCEFLLLFRSYGADDLRVFR